MFSNNGCNVGVRIRKALKYWGKTAKRQDEVTEFHLAVCHCLDVAAVALAWWQRSVVIRDRFCELTRMAPGAAQAWLLFFVALHDLGKFDVRFQSKDTEVGRRLRPEFRACSSNFSLNYYHGEYALHWLARDHRPLSDEWKLWLRAVAGHHGEIPDSAVDPSARLPALELEHDKTARAEFVSACEELFLKPAGLSISDEPSCPGDDGEVDFRFMRFLAGFCSVSDWIGSMEEDATGGPAFTFVEQVDGGTDRLIAYFEARQAIADKLLDEAGIFGEALEAGGMAPLFPEFSPHQVQTLVDKIPVAPGLTLIEAATGSGKTEAALAYASRLLAEGQAESIIFALPTQATANAMLKRLEEVATRLFPAGSGASNLVLAHGKARFNEAFKLLTQAAGRITSQHREKELDSAVACAHWLAQSRKRVFLGQIGVCTVDQVMVSIMPVRHNFVRGFGVGKSVLIIDEVHAYDAYMYGILEEVVRAQRLVGGSVVLLSATLPLSQRQALVDAWTGVPDGQCPVVLEIDAPYPLITNVVYPGNHCPIALPPEEQERSLADDQKHVEVSISQCAPGEMPGSMLPDEALLDEVIEAAKQGALIAVICNLVQDAQEIAGRLHALAEDDIVDLFHSRFRFKDRQAKEAEVLRRYGKKNEHRASGRILVATQVAEQSLDLDFDWMITQLCPIDGLFQRLGRLHRHDRKGKRPQGFEEPRCTVLVPKQVDKAEPDYGLHGLIYGLQECPNTQVLWRSEQALGGHRTLEFPACYRPLIERVYTASPWEDEPEAVVASGFTSGVLDRSRKSFANSLTRESIKSFRDTDTKVALLTRDGEMSLNVVPVRLRGDDKYLLDERADTPIIDLPEHERDEIINMHSVPVPATWRGYLPDSADDHGIFFIPFTEENSEWRCDLADGRLIYTVADGLRRIRI